MKQGYFKLVAVSVSDTDTPWTRVGHMSDMPCGVSYIFIIFLNAGHPCPMARTCVSLQGTQKSHGGVQFAILKNIFGDKVKNYNEMFAIISLNPNMHPITSYGKRETKIDLTTCDPSNHSWCVHIGYVD